MKCNELMIGDWCCDGNCRRMKNYDRRLKKEQEDLLARLTNSEDSACKKD